MLRLIACFGILCLSLAGGFPVQNKDRQVENNRDFENSDVLHSPWPLWKNEFVYAVCEGEGEDKQCTAYREEERENLVFVYMCKLALRYEGDAYRSHYLFNVGNARAVIVKRVNDTRIKLINVPLLVFNDVTETTVDVPRQPGEHQAWWYFTKVFVVPRGEKSYDLFFRNEELCRGFLCRATYDYDGKLVKAASAYPVKVVGDNDLYRVVAANNGDLVAHSVGNVTNVYLVKNGENQISSTLFSGTYDRPYVSLSTEESKLGSCLHLGDNVVCKQFDGEGKAKIIDIDIPVKPEQGYPFVDMYNLERGFLLMTVEFRPTLNDRNSKAAVSVSRIDEQGKLKKTIDFDWRCAYGNLIFGKIFKNTYGHFCVNAVCLPSFASQNNRSKFSRTTKCYVDNSLF